MSTELKLGILVGVLVIAVGAFYFSGRNSSEPELLDITMPQTPPSAPEKSQTPEITTPELLPQPIEPEQVNKKSELTEPLSPPKKALVKPETEEPVVSKPPVQPKEEIRKPRYHEIVKGDTLYNIAESYYGHGRFSKYIFQANKKIMKNPDALKIGWKLRIPYREEILEK